MESCGFNSSINDNNISKYEENELNKILTSVLIALTSEALDLANTYSKHSMRNCITETDISYALMYQCKNFIESDNFEDSVSNILSDLNNEDKSDDESDDESDDDSDDESGDGSDDGSNNKENIIEDKFKKSHCQCDDCNNINNVTLWWYSWNPEDELMIALKNSMNRAITDCMVDL